MNTKSTIKAASMNSGNLKDLRFAIELSVKSDIPLFVHGSFGLGKSAAVEQAAEAMSMTAHAVYTSQIMPEDAGGIVLNGEFDGEPAAIRGMPDIIQAVRKLRTKTGRPVLLFLDEINGGSRMVMAAIQSLILTREAAGYRLPEDTRIIAAGNTEDDEAVIETVPMPVNNRFMHFNYTGPTIDEWEEYALQKGVHPVVLGYLKQRPDMLAAWGSGGDMVDPSAPEVPTPRTWDMLSTALHAATQGAEGEPPRELGRHQRRLIVSMLLGSHVAQDMETVFELAGKLVPARKVLDDPQGAKLPPAEDMKARYLQTVMICSEVIAHPDNEDFQAGMAYVARMGEDMSQVYSLALVNAARGAKAEAMSGILAANAEELLPTLKAAAGHSWASK